MLPVSEKEQQEINVLVRRFEADTAVEAVAAVVSKADAYPELPWKAYALGSALGALAAVMLSSLLIDWALEGTLALTAMAILGGGVAFAAAATFVPAFGRLFLDRLRARAEARQYALGLFVEREIFRTPGRTGVLVLVSRFERVAVILADSGLAACAPSDELERIAHEMHDALAEGPVAAFERGLDALAALIKSRGVSPGAGRENALDDAVIAERGA